MPGTPMARHEQSITIRRPVAEVFAYMDDISRETEWQSQLVEAHQSPAGPTAVGTRKRYVSQFLGKRLENTYVVEVYEPDRRVVCRSTPDSVLNATTELLWEDVGGETRITMSLDGAASGPLRFVPAAMLEATFEKEVRTTLARLKERLESPTT
jgi:carbon monoxide dehydrogenase subunit G